MRKYILVSFTPGSDEDPIQVAVPYVTEVDLDTLMYILTKDSSRTAHEKQLVDKIHEQPPIVTPIDLASFTHFVQEV